LFFKSELSLERLANIEAQLLAVEDRAQSTVDEKFTVQAKQTQLREEKFAVEASLGANSTSLPPLESKSGTAPNVLNAFGAATEPMLGFARLVQGSLAPVDDAAPVPARAYSGNSSGSANAGSPFGGSDTSSVSLVHGQAPHLILSSHGTHHTLNFE
jgi:hypothetical protein